MNHEEKQKIISELEGLFQGHPWALRDRLEKYIQELKKRPTTYEPKPRTSSQNRALHKFCSLLAESLNLAGLEMRVVLKPDYKIWWTMEAVKEHIFKPVMKHKFGKESTTELSKLGEIDEIHEDIMRMFGEKFGLEYIPFPHDPEKDQDYKTAGRKIEINYPNGEN